MALQLHPDKQQQRGKTPHYSTEVSITDLVAAKSVLLDPELRLAPLTSLMINSHGVLGYHGICNSVSDTILCSVECKFFKRPGDHFSPI